SPPAIAVPVASASVSASATSASASASAKPGGSVSETNASPGPAPIAARSESAPARALRPTSAGVAQSPPRRKWTPSTIVSVEVTASFPPARTTAASSPVPRSSLRATAGLSSAPAIASIRDRSAMPVDDPRSVQVVGRELAAHAIAGQDADAEAPHLACHMAEHDVVVVQLHAEHRVRQGLDHLALEFDLVLLRHAHSHPAADAACSFCL